MINYDIRPQTLLMTQGNHLQNDSFSLHMDWYTFVYVPVYFISKLINLIFLIKLQNLLCAVDKNRSDTNFSDASRFSSNSFYAHARGMRKWEGYG